MQQYSPVVDQKLVQGLVPLAHHVLTLEAQVLAREGPAHMAGNAGGDVGGMGCDQLDVQTEDRRDRLSSGAWGF